MSIYLPGNDLRDHWFKVGRTEVGTTLLVCAAVVAGWLAVVVKPDLVQAWALFATAVPSEPWRLLTWPLADGIGLMSALNLFFFWVFGTELEQRLGKVRMAQLLAAAWLVLTIVAMALGMAADQADLPRLHAVLAGIGTIEFLVFLVWIGENARRQMFFGIPAWVVGAVLLAISLLSYLQARAWGQLLCLLVGMVVMAAVARRFGLLSDLDWIPVKAGAAPGSRRIRKAQQQAQRQAADRAKDDARLDELLDLISANGLDSLTSSQRRELMKLRSRRG